MTITEAVASDSNSGSRRTAAPARRAARGESGHSGPADCLVDPAPGSAHGPPGQPQIIQQAGSAEPNSPPSSPTSTGSAGTPTRLSPPAIATTFTVMLALLVQGPACRPVTFQPHSGS